MMYVSYVGGPGGCFEQREVHVASECLAPSDNPTEEFLRMYVTEDQEEFEPPVTDDAGRTRMIGQYLQDVAAEEAVLLDEVATVRFVG